MQKGKFKKRQIVQYTIFGSLLAYTLISLLISFLHHHHEDPTRFHDDCPACRWEQQSQEHSDDYFTFTTIPDPQDSFTGLISIECSYTASRELFIIYPTRSPPSSK